MSIDASELEQTDPSVEPVETTEVVEDDTPSATEQYPDLYPSADVDPPFLSADDARTNLRTYYESSKAHGTADDDAKWYDRENKRAETWAAKSGTDPTRFRAMAAALSPKTPWDKWGRFINLDLAHEAAVISAQNPKLSADQLAPHWAGKQGLHPNWIKAIRIHRGEDPDTVLGEGPKTHTFFANLEDPEGTRHIPTVDSLMIKAILGGAETRDGDPRIGALNRNSMRAKSGGGYGWVQRRIVDVANEVGRTPQELQAIVWQEYRRLSGR